MERPLRNGRLSAKRKREQAQKAEELKQHRRIALTTSVTAICLIGTLLFVRNRSLEQTGHFRVPASLLAFVVVLVIAAIWSLAAWLRDR